MLKVQDVMSSKELAKVLEIVKKLNIRQENYSDFQEEMEYIHARIKIPRFLIKQVLLGDDEYLAVKGLVKEGSWTGFKRK